MLHFEDLLGRKLLKKLKKKRNAIEVICLHTCIERILSSYLHNYIKRTLSGLKLSDLIVWNERNDWSWGNWAKISTHTFSVRKWKLSHTANVPACFLKDTAYVIAKPLIHVMNLSSSTGIIPIELKAARVNSLFKTGETHKFDNYRPISILPVISKIFEKFVHNQLMNYLECVNQITDI